MSGEYPVPFGYLSMFDALDRARLEFPSDTKAKLKGLLISGHLRAWRADATGSVAPIDPAHWSGKHAQLGLAGNEVRTGAVYLGKKSEGRPVFLETDLDKHLPTWAQRMQKKAPDRHANSTVRAASVEQSEVVPRLAGKPKGRKPNPDADRFWMEVCRHISDGTVSKTLPAFINTMCLWANKAGTMKQPWDDDTIRKKLTALFDELGWESRVPD